MRKPLTKILRVAAIALVVVAALVVGGGIGATKYLEHRIKDMRIGDPFAGLSILERPPVKPGVTILLAGVDSAPSRSRGSSGGTDALLLLRIAADRKAAYVVSIPRDSWVMIPGYKEFKINHAYARGGPALSIRTVEALTGIHIDHFIMVDLHGFRDLADAVGGVTVTVPFDTYDPSQNTRFAAGEQTLDGERALQYVRQRHGLPRGDLDRVRRQQQFLLALFDKLATDEVLLNPRRLDALLDAVAKTAKVDSGFGVDKMLRLARDARELRGHIQMVTAPTTGFGMVGPYAVVWLDEKVAAEFWNAIGTDQLDAYLATHKVDTLDGPPR